MRNKNVGQTVSALIFMIMCGIARAQTDAGSATVAIPDATSLGAAIGASPAANRALSRKVKNVLAKTRGLTAWNIVVKAKDGTVTLTGSVPAAAQIDLAVSTTQQVSGVTSVDNRLAVRIPGSIIGR